MSIFNSSGTQRNSIFRLKNTLPHQLFFLLSSISLHWQNTLVTKYAKVWYIRNNCSLLGTQSSNGSFVIPLHSNFSKMIHFYFLMWLSLLSYTSITALVNKKIANLHAKINSHFNLYLIWILMAVGISYFSIPENSSLGSLTLLSDLKLD